MKKSFSSSWIDPKENGRPSKYYFKALLWWRSIKSENWLSQNLVMLHTKLSQIWWRFRKKLKTIGQKWRKWKFWPFVAVFDEKTTHNCIMGMKSWKMKTFSWEWISSKHLNHWIITIIAPLCFSELGARVEGL